MANFNWTFVNVDGVVNVNAISASTYISASTIYATDITASNYIVENVHNIDVSGSTTFGNSNDDMHIRTGSLLVASSSTTIFSASVSTTPGSSFIYASKMGVATTSPSQALTVVGDISASVGITGSTLETATTFINATHVSSSLNISGAAFYGDGSLLTGISPITTYSNASDNRVITSVDSSTISGEANLTFDGSKLSATGQISASLGVTGSAFETATTVINSTHISSSLNVSASEFYGNGAKLTGISPITTYSNAADNRVLTSVDASSINSEANLIFDGTDFTVISTTSGKPRIVIQNENVDDQPGKLIFHKTSSSPAENDMIGRVEFLSYDAAGNPTTYARFSGDIKKSGSGGERGRIKFEVAEYDGTLTEALTLQGDNSDGTVSVTVANGTLYVPNGSITASVGITGSTFQTADTVINSTHISSSLNVSASAFYGDGSKLDNVSTTPGGSDTHVQYNNGGAFGGVASLTFNDSSGDLTVIDDKKLFFGSNSDAYIEYDETGSDRLILSGAAAGGLEISGSAVYLDINTVGSGTLAGGSSYLGVDSQGRMVLTASSGGGTTSPAGSDTQIQFNDGGAFGAIAAFTWDDTNLKIADDTKLLFGSNSDAYIEYDENSSDKLIISASSGPYISGSAMTIATNLTVTGDTDDNPSITIENNSDGVGGGSLTFTRTTTDEAANDIIGNIQFMAKDGAGNLTVYAGIQGQIDDPTSGGEEGRLIFKVAEFDGNQTEGFRIEGQAVNGIVDCLVSNGSLQLKDLGGAGTTPASGVGGLYVNADKLYFINDSGGSTELGAGTSATGNNTFSGTNTFSAALTASSGIDLGGSLSYATAVKTADFTAGFNEYLFFCDLTGSAITGTLPDAGTAGAGKSYIFKDVSGSASTYNLVVSGSGADLIDGATQVKITSNSGSVTCVSNGSDWFIIGTS